MHDDISRLNRSLAGRYRIERQLAVGGMARVYAAHDERHGRDVAIKVIAPELTAAVGAERFATEIATTARLHHPHILPLFDSGDADGLLFYVMPLSRGESLRERLSRLGPLELHEALTLIEDVAGALEHAHARGVVHRDIKPGNILVESGEALVMDFGIARGLSGADRAQLTHTGLSLGTPAYMSPEQMGGDAEVDARADVYSLGCVLYEMLAGEPPFMGTTAQAVMARALTEAPPSVRSLRPDVPEPVDAAIRRALAKNPEDRFPSVRAFHDACRSAPAPSVGGADSSRRALVGTVAVALTLVLILGGLTWRASRVSGARALLTEITRLADEGRYEEAYGYAVSAERWIPEDSLLGELLTEVSDELVVTSEPAGARVHLQPLPAEGTETESRLVGTTPLDGLRIPRVDHRVVVSMEGWAPVERIASSALSRNDLLTIPGPVALDVTLHRAAEIPDDMVAVPGGAYEMVGPDAPIGLSTQLEDFFIDRYEVTNAAFAAFLDGGGYSNPANWVDAPDVPPASGLVDRTGLPGPRGWVRQEFPEGEDDFPVTGVTWFEAAAYCRSLGKRLPTVYEWEKTARDGKTSSTGVLMPWGYAGSAGGSATARANFNSDGPVRVDAFPFSVSPYGAYGMAGNVREWTANRFGSGYAVTGGAWDGPAYLYPEYAAQPGVTATAALGFRCATSEGTSDQGAGAIDLDIEPPSYTPVDEAGFRTLLQHYRYDRRETDPRIAETVETQAWTRERIWIDGVGADSILLYLYTPKTARPPFQTIVYVPGSSVFCCETVPGEMEWAIGPTIQAGRAVLAPVLEGMRERGFGPEGPPTDPGSVRFRDLMVRQATELRLGIDYLETRSDVDVDRLAYVAVSFGAGSRLAFSVVDDRYRAVVYVGGGIDERVKPTLPEADNVNFAPYVGVPTLLVNGRSDEEHPWPTRGVALWNLLREPKELVLVEGGGHIVPLEIRIPAINDFLDRVMGPVE